MFNEFPKIARLSRECVITEKIDGTNASVWIDDIEAAGVDRGTWEGANGVPLLYVGSLAVRAGSRTRFVSTEKNADNAGWARWVTDNAFDLVKLGPGVHYGEWWGSGIQRGYGLNKGEKRFSLFNTGRWYGLEEPQQGILLNPAPSCCHVVPVLYTGLFTTQAVDEALATLAAQGSWASPGFMKPEGIVIWHEAARVMFKKTLEKDEMPKGQVQHGLA